MTVSTLNSSAEFATNGVTTVFPIGFKFLAAADLNVTYTNSAGVTTDLVLGTDYTVSGAGSENGGSITTTTALATGQLAVERDMLAYQETSLRNQGRFFAETHEQVFDRLTMLIQQIFGRLGRALFRPLGRNYFDAEGRQIKNVADPTADQDATTKNWTQQYVAEILATGQGPINNAANIVYTFPDGTARKVQDLSSTTIGSQGIGHDGRDLADTINWNAVAYLVPASDFSAQLQDFANNKLSGAVKTGTLKPGVRRCLSQVTFPANVNLNLHGVTLDFSEATTASSFPNLSCVMMGGGTFTALPTIASGVAVGTYQLTFSSAPDLKSGDTICIWNPADFSFSGFRANYYAGEFSQVRYRSGNTVVLSTPFLSSYPSNVQLFKLGGTAPIINGGTIVMPQSLVLSAGIFCELSLGARLENMNVLNTSGAGIVIERSVNTYVSQCRTSSNLDSVAQDNYGLVLSNVQSALVLGGTFNAKRHAITMGGNGFAGCVPTRFAKVIGADLSSWDIQCADMHGNVEFSTYQNCTLRNGVTISGNNNSVRGGSITAPANPSTGNGVAISVNEMKGTNFQFENLNIIAYGDPSTTSRGVIDIGGNSNAMTANTTLGGCISLRNINLSAANARIPFKCINAGSTAANKSIVYDVKWNDAPANRLSNFWTGVSSGSNFSRIDLKGMRFNDVGAPATIVAAADFVCGLSETGSTTITTAASSSVQNFVVTFANRFPKAPKVMVTADKGAAGPLINVYVSATDTTGFTISIIPASGSTTAGVAINVSWTASLDE